MKLGSIWLQELGAVLVVAGIIQGCGEGPKIIEWKDRLKVAQISPGLEEVVPVGKMNVVVVFSHKVTVGDGKMNLNKDSFQVLDSDRRKPVLGGIEHSGLDLKASATVMLIPNEQLDVGGYTVVLSPDLQGTILETGELTIPLGVEIQSSFSVQVQ